MPILLILSLILVCISSSCKISITMCTVGSVTGFPILLNTSYAPVNRCVCTIEASSGRVGITYSGQPSSPDCGTRIDFTNNSGIISTFQCQQPKLYESVGVMMVSGEITLHKQSNSTEDDIRYCLLFTGSSVTISCYGTDLQPPTTTTTATTSTTSTTTVRSSTTSTAAIPTTSGTTSTAVTTTTQQQPTTTTSVISYGTSMSTTVMISSTANHQGNNNNMTVARKNNDLDLAVIIAPIIGVIGVIVVVIIIFLLCRRHIKNTSKMQMGKDERNNNFANLSIHTEQGSQFGGLNNIRIISVPVVHEVGYEGIMFENTNHDDVANHSGPGSVRTQRSNEQGVVSMQVSKNHPESVDHIETTRGDMYAVVKRKHEADDIQHLRKSVIPNSHENLYEALEMKQNRQEPSTHLQLHKNVKNQRPKSATNGSILNNSSRSDTYNSYSKSSGMKPMALKIKENEFQNAERLDQQDKSLNLRGIYDSSDNASFGQNQNSHIITEL
ncbi:hypothetical protein ACJMK2_030457 [Sinanodonta woodiana]|uniref:Uncharacterized protein n=1 Tax=Sinanodonta woodiana TaxID=1069815 RepID=A0ABD3XD82_SINWO